MNINHALNVRSVLSYLDVTFSKGGLVASEKVFERFRNPRTAIDIEEASR